MKPCHVYNDPQTHKHVTPPIKKEVLDKISVPMFSIMLLPIMREVEEFATATDAL